MSDLELHKAPGTTAAIGSGLLRVPTTLTRLPMYIHRSLAEQLSDVGGT